MKLPLPLLTLLGAVCWIANVRAQVTTTDYDLSSWTGAAFALPSEPQPFTAREAYRLELLGGDYLQALEFAILDVASSAPEDRFFPGTNLASGWCTMLYATLEVKRAGCYNFSLNSDDGAVLWLDDTLRLDNDGMHKMRLRESQHRLDARAYTAKLWYLDAFPPLYGLQFTLTRLEDASACAKTTVTSPTRLTVATSSVFASGSADLGSGAAASLDALCDQLKSLRYAKLTVTGHTDDVGAAAANQSLSTKRAAAVVRYLRDCTDLEQAQLSVLGLGATAPVGDNATEEGRALNRRVEVLVE